MPHALFPTVWVAITQYSIWNGGAPARDALQTLAVWFNSLDVLNGILSAAASLDPDDMRRAWLSLANYSVFLNNLNFDPVTGANYANVVDPSVLDFSKPGQRRVVTSNADWAYPAVWPWPAPLAAGDVIAGSFDGTGLMLGAVLSVIGAWVAQILLEQAVYSYRKSNWVYLAWAFAVAVLVGLVGIWSSLAAQLGFLSITAQSLSLPIRYSLSIVALAILPALVLSYAGLVVLLFVVERDPTRRLRHKHGGKEVSAETEHATEIRRRQKEELHAKQARAMIDLREHSMFVLRQLSWASLVGGGLVGVAIIVTRVTLFTALLTNATWTSSTARFAIADVFAVLLAIVSMHWSVCAIRLRSLGGFAFMGAVLLEMNVWFSGATFTWTGNNAWSFDPSSSMYSGTLLSAVAMKLLAGVFAAVACLGFVAVQFSRMQLSRNDLALLTARLERSLQTTKKQLKGSQVLNSVLAARAQRYAVMLDVVNLLQPKVDAGGGGASTATLLMKLCADAPPAVLPKGVDVKSAGMAADADVASKSGGAENEGETGASGGNPNDVHNLAQPSRNSKAGASSGAAMGGAGVGTTATAAVGAPRARTSIVSAKAQDSLGSSRPSAMSYVSDDPDDADSGAEQAHAQLQPLKKQGSRAAISRNEGAERGSRLALDANGGGAMDSTNVTNATGERSSVVDSSNMIAVPGAAGVAEGATTGANSNKRGELIELLTHPVCVEMFKAHLARLHSEESLAFYLAVQKYRALPTRQLRQAIAPRLTELFVRDGSPFEINVSQMLRKKLEKEAGGGCGGATELYNAAQQECLSLMETNAWASFVASSAYAVCKAAMRELPVPSNERGAGDERLSLVFQGAENERDSLTTEMTVTRSIVR